MVKRTARNLVLALTFFALTVSAGKVFAQAANSTSTETGHSPTSVTGTDPVPPTGTIEIALLLYLLA